MNDEGPKPIVKNKAERSMLQIFGSEWFGIPISTLALSQVYIMMFGHYSNLAFRYVAEALTFTSIALFLFIFAMWITRGITSGNRLNGGFHWDNLTRLSFISLIPIMGFVGNSQLLFFFGISPISARVSVFTFLVFYALSLLLGVLLGYRLYTKEIKPMEINYAIVIPPLAIGTSVFLAQYLIPYYSGVTGQFLSFLVVMGLGVFFFLFIFIGSLALSGHVSTKMHESLPTTMLPVGIASLIVINLFSISGFGSSWNSILTTTNLGLLTVMLWGFEVWNFLVVLIIMLAKPSKGNMSVWAYGFPLGLFATSTLRIMSVVNFGWLFWIFLMITALLNILWVYGWISTVIYVRKTIVGMSKGA